MSVQLCFRQEFEKYLHGLQDLKASSIWSCTTCLTKNCFLWSFFFYHWISLIKKHIKGSYWKKKKKSDTKFEHRHTYMALFFSSTHKNPAILVRWGGSWGEKQFLPTDQMGLQSSGLESLPPHLHETVTLGHEMDASSWFLSCWVTLSQRNASTILDWRKLVE